MGYHPYSFKFSSKFLSKCSSKFSSKFPCSSGHFWVSLGSPTVPSDLERRDIKARALVGDPILWPVSGGFLVNKKRGTHMNYEKQIAGEWCSPKYGNSGLWHVLPSPIIAYVQEHPNLKRSKYDQKNSPDLVHTAIAVARLWPVLEGTRRVPIWGTLPPFPLPQEPGC